MASGQQHDNPRMSLEDRDWYWKERQRKERLHYDPKAFRRWKGDVSASAPQGGRPGFGTIVVVLLVVALMLAPTAGRWLAERMARHGAVAPRAPAAEAGSTGGTLSSASRK